MIIDINENWAIKTIEFNFVLCKKNTIKEWSGKGRKPDPKNIGKTTYTDAGFFPNLKALVAYALNQEFILYENPCMKDSDAIGHKLLTDLSGLVDHIEKVSLDFKNILIGELKADQ